MGNENTKYYSLSSKQIMATNVELWNLVNDYISDEELLEGKILFI